MDRITAITNVRIFDGDSVIDAHTVVINGAHIQALGGETPAGATVIDAHGATLMPGLIDAHVHTDMDGLTDALVFGVTTELEMMGHWTREERQEISERDDNRGLALRGDGPYTSGRSPDRVYSRQR